MPTGIWLYSYIAVWALAVADCAALVILLRMVGRLATEWARLESPGGLPPGSLAPALPPRDIDGRPAALRASTGRATVLVFVSPGCRSCGQAMPRVAEIALEEGVAVILVVRGAGSQARLFVAEHCRGPEIGRMQVLADTDGALGRKYGVSAVPFLAVVDGTGAVVGSSLSVARQEVRSLLQSREGLTAAAPIPVMAAAVADHSRARVEVA